jgi:RNA polymerase sigma-70 factor (ECF subfamily)
MDESGDGRLTETLLLLDRARRGDDGARESLFQRLRPRLVLWIASRLSAELRASTDPEDLAQEVLLAAHRGLDRLDGEGGPAFYGWFFRIAENRIRDQVDYFRAKKRQVVARAEDPPTSPSMALERDETLARMREAIGRLPDDYRDVLRLLRFEERGVAEAARLLGRSEGAVRILHLRALRALRREMLPPAMA